MKQLKPEEITKRISNEIKNKFDKETTATVAKNCDNVVDAITFTVEQMRQIPYNVRMFYCIVKERLPDIKNCVNQQTFLEIIHFLRSLCDQKRESLKYGANIIICADIREIDRSSVDSISNLEKESRPFVKNSKFAKTCKSVNSKSTFFVFQQAVGNQKIQNGKVKDFIKRDDISNSMKSLCHGTTIGFSLENDTNCIRIFYQRDLCVEYFLSEITGSWTIRFKDDIKNLISQSGLTNGETERLTNYVISLSYQGLGAMIILTKNAHKIKSYLTDSAKKLDFHLDSVAADNHFINCAKVDGAIIIENKEIAIIRYYGVSISPKCEVANAYKDLVSLCGSRHGKAAQYACEYPDDYIIVISENRTISFLHGKTPIYWRDENVETNYIEERKENS